MENITFEQLPQAVTQLFKELQQIKLLLTEQVTPIIPPNDKLLTISQAAELLNLAIPSVYGLCHRSIIPYMKRSKRLYFSEKELRDWIKSGRRLTIQEIKDDTSGSY